MPDKPDTSLLIGEITVDQLSTEPFSWFRMGYDLFSIDDAASFRAIKEMAGSFHVEAFIGTWCGDTHDQLPGLMRILDATGVPRESVRLIALDRTKRLSPHTDRVRVERIPTFVFYRDGREIGRITESPEETLLKDVARIVSR